MFDKWTQMVHTLQELAKKYERCINVLNDTQTMQGYLEIDDRHGRPQYYHRGAEAGKARESRIYLDQSNIDRIKQLAQQSYNKKMLKLLTFRLTKIKRFLHGTSDQSIDAIYENLKPSRKLLATPLAPTQTQKLDQWLQHTPEPLDYHAENKIFPTKHGERVRSKSEKILADIFHDHHIAYKYESPLHLDNQTFYPDFTFYDATNDMEIYWEHCGMMDDPTYSDATLKKLTYYQKNGLVLGQNLIVTFESGTFPLSFELVDAYLQRYLSTAYRY